MSCIPTNSNLLGNRVAVFGISANPPTGKCGHVGIVRYLVQSAEFSEVWILPVYKHMYESKNKSTVTYQQKLEMCRLCMEIESTSGCKVRVLELEKEAADYYKQEFGSDYRVGTVDIISYIYKSNSSLKISLVLGTDTFNDLQAGRWKESEK